MKKAGKVTTEKLTALALELEKVQAEVKRKEKELEALKADKATITAQIVKLSDEFELPIKEGRSEYLNVGPDRSLRITRKRASVSIDPAVMIEELGRVDPDTFFDVCEIKKLDIDETKALQAIAEERMRVSTLDRAKQQGKPPKPEVGLGKFKHVE